MSRPAYLVLEDGFLLQGRSVGAEGEVFGELVFNTSMTGYQEILTDPSYKGQIVTMTYPHIGNYGVNEDDVESRRPWVEGFVMRELSPIASNFRSQEPLDAYLKRHRIVAIDGVDTRALTLALRQQGSMKSGISTTETDPQRLWQRVRASPDIVGADLVKEVTCEKPYEWPTTGSPVSGLAGLRVNALTGQPANRKTSCCDGLRGEVQHPAAACGAWMPGDGDAGTDDGFRSAGAQAGRGCPLEWAG
ncbi:MAG: carbamoyl-phosphate synthase domain-containing protein [Candidatus Omnitrophota bacterium]|nr:carbamoyl-phosphate synthase domain-containing protein [Candidatus Omnitrophota bacterium]